MAFDDTFVYILEPPEVLGVTSTPQSVPNDAAQITRQGRILKCPLAGCDNPQVVYTSTNEINMFNLVVDDRFVYFSGDYCTVANSTGGPFFTGCKFVAVVPK